MKDILFNIALGLFVTTTSLLILALVAVLIMALFNIGLAEVITILFVALALMLALYAIGTIVRESL